MTNIYAHISDGDAPKSQHVTEVSFVDETGKHIDIGGGETTEIHPDATLAGTGTTDNPLKLSDDTNSKIAKAGTLTEDNLTHKDNVDISYLTEITPVEVRKDSSGHLSLMYLNSAGLAKHLTSEGVEALMVPAIGRLAKISTLDSSAELTAVINKINEILKTVKNAL